MSTYIIRQHIIFSNVKITFEDIFSYIEFINQINPSAMFGHATRTFCLPTEQLSVLQLETQQPCGSVGNRYHLKIGKAAKIKSVPRQPHWPCVTRRL